MQLIRVGFDGLDISYNLSITKELAERLEEQRAVSEADEGYMGLVIEDGVQLLVEATGAKGGYRYRCDTGLRGSFGEVWFFKRPSDRLDPWGVRVSCRALPLALDGLAKVRSHVEETLYSLGIHPEPGLESIGRIDVACDILAPGFTANRDHIVAHAQSKISEVSTDLMQVVGRSGRVETITVGKNPQRQVVLYDKRAEVIATRKNYWWPIWDAALAAQGLPPLDRTDRDTSSVWRVEVRAYKRHLKDTWNVSTWGDLRTIMIPIIEAALKDIRYTVPTGDSNRSRWPDHPIWGLAREALSQDLEEVGSTADIAGIKDMLADETNKALRRQILSLMISHAAWHSVPPKRLASHIEALVGSLLVELVRDPGRAREKLRQARNRYGDVEP